MVGGLINCQLIIIDTLFRGGGSNPPEPSRYIYTTPNKSKTQIKPKALKRG